MADLSVCDNPDCDTAVSWGDTRNWPELWYKDGGHGQRCEFCSLGCLGHYVERLMRKPLRELRVKEKHHGWLWRLIFG